ncbi:MAG: hypothetical protein ABSC50_12695 [Candidatus Bathyarchaeia archaeon]
MCRKVLSALRLTITRHFLWIVVMVSFAVAIFLSGILSLTLNELLNLKVVGTIFAGDSLIDATLASLATIIAIYFSISILAVQNAASNYTASILEYYKKDAKSWMTYLFLMMGLSLSAFMLNQEASLVILASGQIISLLNVSTVLLIASFFVLALQFVHICDLVNPRTLISNARSASIRDIRKAPSKVTSIQDRTKMLGFEKLLPREFFQQFVFHQNEGTVLRVSHEKLLQIIDIVYKCAMKRETETYLAGFSAIADIAESYVSIRETDPSPDDKFLNEIYDKLLSVSKIAFDNKDTQLLQETIRTLEKVGISTAEIKPLSRISGSNQSTKLAIWHVHDLGEQAIRGGLWDGAAQAVLSIRNIGIQAIKQTGDESLASNRILPLGKGAIAGREWHLTNISISALSELLFQSVLAKTSIYADPTNIMEAIEQLGILALDKGLNEFALISLFTPVSQTSLGRTVYAALKVKNEEYPIIETAAREGYVKEVVSRLLECIHKIGLAASKNNSPVVLHNIFDCVAGIMDLLFKEKFTTAKDGFREELLEAIGTVSSSYIIRSGDIHPWFVWGGEDVLTELAFAALSQGQDEISTACEKSVLGIANTLIEIDKHGYDSPRLASRIAVIGVFALHKSNKGVAQECANDLAGFDKKYMKRSPSPRPMLHIKTMHEDYEKSKEDWRRDQKWEEAFCQVTEDELKSFEDLFRKAGQ